MGWRGPNQLYLLCLLLGPGLLLRLRFQQLLLLLGLSLVQPLLRRLQQIIIQLWMLNLLVHLPWQHLHVRLSLLINLLCVRCST